MLKGYAKIEITDVETGEVHIVEQENMITNAVPDMLNAKAAWMGAPKETMNCAMYPLAEKAFGGLLLFENPLEESEEKYILPAPFENPLTGYADNVVNNSTDTKRGSRNLTESGPVQNGYKYVYDFATSQGNGTISALALTNAVAGAAPYANTAIRDSLSSSTKRSSVALSAKLEQNTYDFVADLLNAVEFNFHDYSFTSIVKINATTLRRRKYQFNFKTSHLAGTFDMPVLLTEEIFAVDNAKTIINTASRFVDGKDGYVYAIYKSGSNLYISRLSKENLTQDEAYGTKAVTNLYSGMSMVVNAYNDEGKISSPYKYNDCCIHNGCLYIGHVNANIKCIYKINLSNTADVETISGEFNAPYPICERDENGIFVGGHYLFDDGSKEKANQYILQSYGSYPNNFDDSDSAYNFGHTAFYDKNKSVNFYCSSSYVYMHFAIMLNYLATINNLDEAVIKTSDKTMKITYTLTEQ